MTAAVKIFTGSFFVSGSRLSWIQPVPEDRVMHTLITHPEKKS
jgi:hypothetical protein